MRSLLLLMLTLLLVPCASAQGPEWEPAPGPYGAGPVSVAYPSGALLSVHQDHVRVSYDDGATWTHRGTHPLQDDVPVLLGDGRLLTLDRSGDIVRSDDLGASWEMIAGLSAYLSLLDRAPDGTLYAASSIYVFVSHDDGATWEELPPPHVGDGISVLSAGVGLGPLAGGSSPFDFTMSLRRYDHGTGVWQNTGHAEMLYLHRFVRGFDGFLYGVANDEPRDSPSAEGGVFRSADGGVTWTQVYGGPATGAFVFEDGEVIVAARERLVWDGPDLSASSVIAFVRSASGTLFANSSGYCESDFDLLYYCLNGTGAYRLSPSADTWHQVGYVNTHVHALAVGPDGAPLAGTEEAVLAARDGGWTAAGWNRGPVRALAASETEVYVASDEEAIQPAGLRRLSDGEPLPVTDDCESVGCGAVAVAVTPQGTLLTSLTPTINSNDAGLFRSADEGATWTETLPDVGTVRVLEAGPGGRVYAGARGGTPDGIFRSDDDGETWVPYNEGLTNREVHALLAPSQNVVLAGTEDGVFQSTGGAWAPGGLAGHTVHALAVAAVGLLAGTDAGLFLRTGAGAWASYGSGLEGRTVLSLLVTTFEGEELVVAGTEAGVYLSRPGLITTEREPSAYLPGPTALLAPYPNPSRGGVTLAFELAEAGPVRLVVYDVLGREVARVTEAPFSAGQHAVSWRPEGESAGTYFVTLEAGGVRTTRPLVLVR